MGRQSYPPLLQSISRRNYTVRTVRLDAKMKFLVAALIV